MFIKTVRESMTELTMDVRGLRIHVIGLAFVIACCVTAIETNDDEEFIRQKSNEVVVEVLKMFEKKIEKLEKNDNNLRASIGTLISTNVQLRIEMEEMSKKYGDMERELREKVIKLSNDIEQLQLSDAERGAKPRDSQMTEEEGTCENDNEEDCFNGLADARPGPYESEGRVVKETSISHAFTAYLDHPIKTSGSGHTLIYNRVLLNEGNVYDEQTGVFTARVTGIYLFSWAIAVKGETGDPADNIWVGLMVNDKPQIGSVVGGRVELGDDQASNYVVLRLTEGDTVWTTLANNKPHVHGADNERTTSFMGVLLYPTLGPDLGPKSEILD